MLHLDRMHIQLLPMPVHIEEDLGRVANRRDGVKRMPIAQQRKIGQRVELQHVGTGQPEEIPQHPVAEPGIRQHRQAVEDETGFPPRLAEHAVNFRDQLLETPRRIQMADGRRQLVGHQRRMIGKPEIDNPLAPRNACRQ